MDNIDDILNSLLELANNKLNSSVDEDVNNLYYWYVNINSYFYNGVITKSDFRRLTTLNFPFPIVFKDTMSVVSMKDIKFNADKSKIISFLKDKKNEFDLMSYIERNM